jgi:glutamyl-tRNA synthetase
MTTYRTRFAPSPTGYLHIGGVRTALFNWLLARRHGGQFILRIDDTDAERNRPEALQPILDGFCWLGIDWDEGPEVGGPYGPYFQSQRNQLYIDAAVKLLETGHAYPDYLSKEELAHHRMESALRAFRQTNPNATEAEIEAERKAASEGNRKYVHRGPHRSTPPAECLRLYREKPTAVRLKVPEGRTIAIDDRIRGHVEWDADLITDPVILRAPDATGIARPLYNFATVVDDVAMKITHIVRGQEHLDNTNVQVMIYEAMGAPLPCFAHVPYVNAPRSREKLSKRKMAQFMTPDIINKLRAAHAVPPDWTDDQVRKHEVLNPATVAFYQALGYLPAGVVNYLGRLGWSLDDKTELIPREEMIANFSLDRVNSSSASFDPDKLAWVAGEYMKQLPVGQKVDGVLPFLQRAGVLGETIDDPTRRKVHAVIEALDDRLKLFSDILNARYFFENPVYDPKAVQQRLRKDGIAGMVGEFMPVLRDLSPFDAATLEERANAFCQARGMKNSADLNHALRVAVTGVMVGPGVHDILAILGREETLRRIDKAMSLPT